MIAMSNIGDQMKVLGNTMTKGLPSEWEENGGQLVDDMGDKLDDLIQKDIFGRKMAPSGAPWKPYSPLTKAIYAVTGQRQRLGGDALKRSFQIGQRGNMWRAGKFKFSLGSMLRAGSYLVAKTFQTSFRFPKSRKAAAKMRKFIAGVTGVPAPSGPRKLYHPGRQIVGWKQSWIEDMKEPMVDAEKDAWNTTAKEAARKVRSVTKMGPS